MCFYRDIREEIYIVKQLKKKILKKKTPIAKRTTKEHTKCAKLIYTFRG